MHIISLKGQNFGSYKELNITPSTMGLSLIYGLTGAGKSTVPDLAAWVLFGVTAKDGNVDEVRSWKAPEEETTGTANVLVNTKQIAITRVRGSANNNDLYWTEEGAETPIRGKDIPDTQKLLERRLGLNSDTYLTASYFHEFSSTGTFFVANAKNRRQLFDKLADLSLPVKLSVKTQEHRSLIKKEIHELELQRQKVLGQLEFIQKSSGVIDSQIKAWEKTQAVIISLIQERVDKEELDKSSKAAALALAIKEVESKVRPETDFTYKLAQLKEQLANTGNEKCPTCNTPRGSLRKFEIQTQIAKVKDEQLANLVKVGELKSLKADLQGLDANVLRHKEQLKAEKTKVNPMKAQKDNLSKDLSALSDKKDELEADLGVISEKFDNLVLLGDLALELRGELVRNAVQGIEYQTNRYLEKYFDSEIRIEFHLEGADNLEVLIFKSGFECVYKQLSRGQRCMLKLAFSVAVMEAAANASGTHVDNLWFDECLDGLSSEFKIKAYGLFEELSLRHKSVVLIDHAESFQNLFDRKYHVVMKEDYSQIQ